MIYRPDLTQVGSIGKPVGYEGQFILQFDQDTTKFKETPHFIFIELNGLPVPFKIIDFVVGVDRVKLCLSEIDTKEKIENYRNLPVFFDSEFIVLTNNNIQNFSGYCVFDQSNRLIGVVSELIDQGVSKHLKVILDKSEKKVLLPFHEDLIDDQNSDKKTIKLQIADGILDL